MHLLSIALCTFLAATDAGTNAAPRTSAPVAPSSAATSEKPARPKRGCQVIADPADRAACFERLALDWPGLSRYAAANKEISPPKANEKRVVFMGDSITDGWSRPDAREFFSGKPYVNRGIGGQVTGQMLVRFRPDVIALAPKVVVILAGTNDVGGNLGPASLEEIEGNLASMAELATAGHIRVVLASILPVSDDKSDKAGKLTLRTADRPPETIRALNQWIAGYARKNKHVFLDYHAALVDARGLLKPETNDDGLHPNGAGYAIMGPLTDKAIAAALKR